jgi:hypothetical protein
MLPAYQLVRQWVTLIVIARDVRWSTRVLNRCILLKKTSEAVKFHGVA